MAFLNFSGSFYFRHKLYIKNFHHQPHPDFQVFLKGGLLLGAAHRPLPVQTFTLFPSVNPQLLRVLAIPAFFNFVSEWQSGVSFKFHTDIGHNYAPEIFFCRITPPPLHRSVSPLPLCSNTDFLFFCTWKVHTFLIRQVRGNGGFGKLKS